MITMPDEELSEDEVRGIIESLEETLELGYWFEFKGVDRPFKKVKLTKEELKMVEDDLINMRKYQNALESIL